MTFKITQEYLHEALNYDAESGRWYWKERPRHHFKTSHGWKIVNARNAGTETGLSFARGYCIIAMNYTKYLAHRLAFLYMGDDMPTEVDHINHIKTDNRWNNLRAVDRIQNCQNAARKKNNKSGETGVWLDKSKKTNKWVVQIRVNRKLIYLGRFFEFDDAVAARRKANETYGFHPNHGT